MAIASGVDGKVGIGSGSDIILNITEWTADIKHAIKNTTSFTESWDTYVKGIRGMSGSLKGIFNAADTNGQAALKTAALNGTTVAIKLFYDTTNSLSATVFIDGLKITNKVDGICEAEFNYTATGAVS